MRKGKRNEKQTNIVFSSSDDSDGFVDNVKPSLSEKETDVDIGIKQMRKRKRNEKQRNIVFSCSDDFVEESERNKLSKSQLLSKVSILETEVKKLRNDLKLYKTMYSILEEFPHLKSRIKDLSSRCKCCRHNKQKYGLCEKNSEIPEKKQKIIEMKSEDISSSIFTLRDKQSKAVNEATCSNTDQHSFQDKIGICQDKSDLNFHIKQTNKVENCKPPISYINASVMSSPTLDHHQAVSPLMEKNSTNVESFSESTLSIKNSKELIIPNQGVQGGLDESHKENDPTKIMILFGSKSLSLATVQKARHSKLSVLAAELCGLVFTIRELALCSLKGKKTNAHKNAFQKQPIDQEKVKGIIGYIAKYFSKSPDDIKDDVYKAIGNKLNNFSKTSEGKKIINEYLAEKAQQQNGQQQQQQVDEQQVEINPQQVAVKTEPQEQAVQQYDEQQLIVNQKTDVINTSNQKTDNAPLLLQLAALNKVANPDQQEALQQLINLAELQMKIKL
ncbi:uncharacterized protein [Temnothorax longispinosus]|uniref:uncharacterized protein n=1 Tax=Temnothorax longispinosus TaxID=300112 RepID=UPI003A9A0857